MVQFTSYATIYVFLMYDTKPWRLRVYILSNIVEDVLFLAHLWCAYAMALCLSWIVRREVGCVCVEHNYPKMWMD